jgi:hypothetical protein
MKFFILASNFLVAVLLMFARTMHFAVISVTVLLVDIITCILPKSKDCYLLAGSKNCLNDEI